VTAQTNPIAALIGDEVRRSGTISFARFMELALYAPGLGYYERQREIGRRGDFYTSVSVGPLLGELLAFQFAQWLDGSDPVQIVEAGPHQGTLAADILGWMQRRQPELFPHLEYCLVESSATHRAWQEKNLQPWLAKIKWLTDIGELGGDSTQRIIFSNEFLDATPVHSVAWNAAAKKWEERRVGLENSGFIWQQSALAPELESFLPPLESALADVLPNGFTIEISPAAISWWEKAAAALTHGKLLTFDYGFTANEWLRPEHNNGTLRTFSRHHAGGNVLENPGESDLTAHVNFSAIQTVGESAGLITDGLFGQEKFLTQILAQIEAAPETFEAWTPPRTRQFQTLTHPDHLGRAFRVLIQSRGQNV
jgi:SAM-dependent MidA family methyltransferase